MNYDRNSREEWNTYVPQAGFKQKLINCIKKVILKEKATSESYIKYLRSKGMIIGKGTYIRVPSKTGIDIQNPWLIEIGENVRILKGVTILTHDFSWSAMTHIEGNILGGISPVKIGNNVFLGMHSTVLRGVTIGDNVIIGAGSIVSRDCEPNSVYAGIPAKRICSIEELYEKRKAKCEDEAKEIAKRYYKRMGKRPDEKVLREYGMLFLQRDDLPDWYELLMLQTGYFDKCYDYYKNNPPKYNGLDEFLDACGLPK